MSFEYQSKKNLKWKDVTSDLFAGIKDMSLGQIIMKPNYTLHDTMSAAEILEARMDSGMNAENILTIDERLVSNLLPKHDSFTFENILAVLDSSIALLMTFFSGFSAPQTLFTCVYLQKPDLVKSDPFLYSFFTTILKLSDSVMNLMQQVRVNEEEDFVLHYFGFSFASEISSTELITILEEGEKQVRSKFSDSNQLNSLLARLNIIKNLNLIVTKVFELQKTNQSKFAPELKKLIEDSNIDIELISKTIQQQPEIVNNNNYANKEKEKEKEKEPENPLLLNQHLPKGVIDPDLIRRIPAQSMTRVVTPLNVSNALTNLKAIFNQLEHLHSGMTDFSFQNLDSLFGFLEHFYQQPTAGILMRTILSVFLPTEPSGLLFGRVSKVELLKNSLTAFGVPKEFLTLASDKLGDLVNLVSRYARFFCYNRARLRRKIGRIFSDVKVVQENVQSMESEVIKQILSKVKFPGAQGEFEMGMFFSTWLFLFIINWMQFYLDLGIELELYAQHELVSVYWYKEQLFSQSKRASEYGFKKGIEFQKLKVKRSMQHQIPNTLTPIQEQFTIYLALGFLSSRVTYLMMIMHSMVNGRGDKHLNSGLKLGTDEFRFFQRFNEFYNLDQPQAMQYAQFVQNTSINGVTVQKLLETSADILRQAKGNCDVLRKFETLLPEINWMSYRIRLHQSTKFLVSDGLSVAMVEKGMTSLESSNLDFDWTVHPFYPVLKFSKQKKQ